MTDSLPVVLCGAGASLMIGAATGLLPQWLSPGVAFLAAVWLLSVGMAVVVLVAAIREDR